MVNKQHSFEYDDIIWPLTDSPPDACNGKTLKQNISREGLKKHRDEEISKSIEHSKALHQNWKNLARKACNTCADPWLEDFHVEQVRRAIRHKYDPKSHEWTQTEISVRIESQPFDAGAQRLCFRVKKVPAKFDRQGLLGEDKSCVENGESWKNASNYVAKCYKNPTPKSTYFKDVQLQMDAKLWAEEYNRHRPPKSIDIIQMTLIELLPLLPVEQQNDISNASADRNNDQLNNNNSDNNEFNNRYNNENVLFHLERYIQGDYVKYNSNTGFVRDEDTRMTPQAFSHFTFERSGHALIVVDIQGVDDLWTDPQIHTAAGIEYNEGNLGLRGMSLFFHSHLCNKICESLKLSKFDLSPREHEARKAFLDSITQNSETRIRGDELACQSPNSIAESNDGNYTPKNDEDLEEEDDIDQHMGILFHQSRLNHRSSCIENELDLIALDRDFSNHFSFPSPANTSGLNCNSFIYEHNNSETSILGKIHLDLCRCHENGRFSVVLIKDEDTNTADLDLESALFHLKLAAQCQIAEACQALARLYLDIPREILPDFQLQDNITLQQKEEIGLNHMEQAAKLGDRFAMLYLAQFYENCSNSKLPSKLNPIAENNNVNPNKTSTKQAVYWLKQAISLEENGILNCSDSVSFTEPLYSLYARLGHLYQMQQNSSDNIKYTETYAVKAAESYTKAAELAVQAMKGSLANKYYILAEECAKI